MNKFESDWISLSARVRVEESVFEWSLSQFDKKVSESKMAVSESNMVEFKVAAIIKLSQNKWVEVFFVQMVGTNLGKCEWVWEEKLRWLNPRRPNSRWQNSRWLPSSSWVRMNKFESDWISLSAESEWSDQCWRVWVNLRRKTKAVWIQHGRIEDGCHHQVESEWMSKVFFGQMVGREMWV